MGVLANGAVPDRRDLSQDRADATAGEPDGRERIDVVVPVIAERLVVGKRLKDTGGVRVSKVIRQHQEEVDVPLLHEEVEVERRPIGRYIDQPVSVRTEGDVMIVPVMEEVLLVEKRLFLKEELHLHKRTLASRHVEQQVLRGEEVIVERMGPAQEGGKGQDPGEPTRESAIKGGSK